MKEAIIESQEEKPRALWKRILVPIDFSELSKEAINIAVSLAKQFDGKITLLHVVNLSNAASIETGTVAYEVMKSARRSLDEMAAEIPSKFLGEKIICFSAGGISQKIVEMACQVSSDLIVLATHAYGFLKRLLQYSTTESVNRHAPCAVLIVRENKITNNKIV
jgi:nucleotide-binding universal stress UspA family protein